jgi:hypothetical protein
MALKTKQKRFKEISGKMDTGGAPIHNDDLIMLQQNSDADFINSAEYYRRKLPALMFYDGIGNPTVKKFENGLILSGLTYDNTNPSAPVLSEGYFLSGGEVCYYAGGSFVTPNPNPFLVFLRKGTASYTSRVFNDGFNKEITVNYSVVVETSQISGQGNIFPPASTIVSTDEVVVIEMGNVSDARIGESYFTKEAAMNVQSLGDRLSTNNFFNVTDLSVSATVGSGNFMNFMGSRIDKDGGIDLTGSLTVVGAAGSALAVFKINTGSNNFPALSGNIPFPITLNVGSDYETTYAIYSPFSRFVTIPAPTIGATPGTFTTSTKYFFSARLMNEAPTGFAFNKGFLDIT